MHYILQKYLKTWEETYIVSKAKGKKKKKTHYNLNILINA